MIKKFVDAVRLYRIGIFRIYLNKLRPNIFQFQTFLIYVYNLSHLKESADQPAVDLFRVEQPGDELFHEFRKSFPAKVFEERLSEPNQVLYLALKDDQVSGYGWLASCHLDIETINYTYPMDEDEAFIHACYVPKHARGKSIYSTMLKKMLYDSKMNGLKKVYIGVTSANAGSIRGIEKSGFILQHKIHYSKIGKNEWWKGIPKSAMVLGTVDGLMIDD